MTILALVTLGIDMKMLILILLIGSCAKHSINGIPNSFNVKVDPVEIKVDVETASAICNERFGLNTVDSNKCFMSYLNFLDAEISLDLESIEQYCSNRKTNEQVDKCVNDLLAIMIGGN